MIAIRDACENQTRAVGECPPLYENERQVDNSESGEIEGCCREAFESWGCVTKAITVLEGEM